MIHNANSIDLWGPDANVDMDRFNPITNHPIYNAVLPDFPGVHAKTPIGTFISHSPGVGNKIHFPHTASNRHFLVNYVLKATALPGPTANALSTTPIDMLFTQVSNLTWAPKQYFLGIENHYETSPLTVATYGLYSSQLVVRCGDIPQHEYAEMNITTFIKAMKKNILKYKRV